MGEAATVIRTSAMQAQAPAKRSFQASAAPQTSSRQRTLPSPGRAVVPKLFAAIPPLAAEERAISSTPLLPLQRKLAIGPVNDPLEAEADAMANLVMRGHLASPAGDSTTPAVRRKCSCEGSGQPCASCEEEKNKLQRKAAGAVTPTEAPPLVHQVLRSPGQPLDATTRAFMEPRFGHDFSSVRVHTDTSAAESALRINAAAYTVGRNIVFGADHYRPGTALGRKLIAHELAHVVQQDFGCTQTIRRQPLTSPRLKGNDKFEKVSKNEAVIKLGDKGPEVRRIQQLLIDLGIQLRTSGANGDFGTETEKAVKKFQGQHGLTKDGIVDGTTLHAFDNSFQAFNLPIIDKDDPWTMSCVLKILCPWNKHLVEKLLPKFNITKFDSISVPQERWDGTQWITEEFKPRGLEDSKKMKMAFKKESTCERIAFAIYHEGWHAQQPSSLTGVMDLEKDAYISGEQWGISMGISGKSFQDKTTKTERKLRTTAPSGETIVDESAAEDLVHQRYGGVSSTAGEQVLARVGASDVQVMKPNGDKYVRPAKAGESVQGDPVIKNEENIDPKSWVCP